MSIEERDGFRIITSNGLPDHEPGQFPNTGNPNTIRQQQYSFRMPLQPDIQPRTESVHPHLFGVALNGVPFDPGTAEFWGRDPRSGWNYDALSGRINLGLDGNNAHVQPGGAYHYHGIPTGLLQKLVKSDNMSLLGYGADGFPIYGPRCPRDPVDPSSEIVTLRSSYRLRDGERPGGAEGPGGRFDGTFVQDFHYVAGSGDLDECNGRYGVTPEYPQGTFYYVLTQEFPFVPRLWRGTPDDSFKKPVPHDGHPPHRGEWGERGDPPGSPPPRMPHEQDGVWGPISRP